MSLTYNQAVEQTITAGEQIHQIVNGTATTEVTVEDGSKVPSIRKALLDNFYFKDPIAWQVGQTENVFNQLRQFTDGSWWYASSATASNPISMGSTPVGNPLWKIYDFDAIGKLTPQLREALRRSYAEAGYNLVDGSFESGGTLVNTNDVLLYEAEGEAYSYLGVIPTGGHPVAPGTNPVGDANWAPRADQLLRGELLLDSGSSLIGTPDGSTVEQSLRRLTYDTVVETKSDTGLRVGDKVFWHGYNSVSDGGSNWGVVYDSIHTEDGLEYFTISGTLHIKANLQGTINPMMAGLFGGATDAAKMQNLMDKSSGKVKLGRGVTYDLTSGLNVNTSNSEVDLNGASLNFTVGLGGYGLYDKGDRNRIHNGSISVNYTAGSGGNGHAGACITLGAQSTGVGISGFKYENLTLTTNRSDAGAHISGLGENRNGKVTKITIPDNAVCRNLIGFEWGGTEIGGTGHPHNIDISKIYVGKITTPTYGASGYAYVVWISGGFNISVKTVFAEEAYGLMMCIAGDKSNDFAPAKYKGAVGSGLSLSNATLMACFGFGIRCVGKGTGETTRTDQRLKASGIYITGKKVGANNNFALQTEFSNGVHLSDFKFDGVWAAGTTTGAEVNNLTVENGEITGCQLYGSAVGSGAVNGKSKSPTIRRVHYYNNNTLAGVGSGTSAVVINESDDALVEHCRFGKEGTTETQRYSVYAAAAANRPRVVHNQTFVNDNPAINPYLLASATVYQVDNTKSW